MLKTERVQAWPVCSLEEVSLVKPYITMYTVMYRKPIRYISSKMPLWGFDGFHKNYPTIFQMGTGNGFAIPGVITCVLYDLY